MSALLDSLLDPERRQQCAANDPPLQPFTILIGKKGEKPRLDFACMASSSMEAWDRHIDLREADERMEVVPVRPDELPIALADNELAQAELRVERERIEADLARDAGKGPRLAARHDAAALDLQVMSVDAMRRAGWL
jgi:hypothetical protein